MSGKIIQHFKGTVFDSGKPVSEKCGNLIFCLKDGLGTPKSVRKTACAALYKRTWHQRCLCKRTCNIKDVFTKDFVFAGGPDIKDVFAG